MKRKISKKISRASSRPGYSPQPPRLEVMSDIKFGLLAEGVRHIVDSNFGIGVVDLVNSPPASGQRRILIADFSGEMGLIERRLAELRSRTTAYQLVVIMLVKWDDIAIQLVRSGAGAVLYPDASTGDLTEAIRNVSTQRTYLPPTLQHSLAERYLSGGPVPIDELTPRELEVCRGLVRGMTTGEVAASMKISVKTADTHRANLLRKLGLRNNVELTRIALRYGLVPP
jgi:DNA-binding NarL/FixJ family response regulator